MNSLISRTLVLLLGSTLALACSKKDGDDKKPETGKTTETTKKADDGIEPFKGELTEEVLKKANRAIMTFDAAGQPADFEPTFAAAKKALGEPTHSEGNLHGWGFAKGEKCTYYALENKAGKAETPGMATIDKAAGGMYKDCMKAIGQALPTVKVDPPPADGVATAAAIRAAAKAESAEWIGKELTIKGLYFSTSTAKAKGAADETATTTLSIIDSKEAKFDGVGCTLPKGTEAPKLTQYDAITVKGTMSDSSFGGLKDCTVVK